MTRITESVKSCRKKQHYQRGGDARCHAAEPEGKQIEHGPWPRNQERRDPDPNRVHRRYK
jgi:hypothetical protein